MVFSLRSRVIRPELLDDAPEPEALENLQDLVRINCRLGGHGVLLEILADVVAQAGEFTFLDVGAATGDTAAVVSNGYPGAGVISLDRHFFHVRNGMGQRVCGDGFRLPFRDHAVDFVLCSLLLHHFPDEKIVELLREVARVARRAVLISDLERRLLAYWFLPATRWLFGWGRITVHDGPISVAAGFRRGELLRLAKEAGLAQARERVHRPAFRISLVAPVPDSVP
jgi:SAM-dependent methyltransferase